MPIVLAIEPDRRQAAHLSAIVRHQVGAELVIADTTEGALDAIGNRVPDLVLVPALLSPQDDAALAAALRVIAAAAHVRTLTIPVLASGTKRSAAGGMLAKWRKKSASQETDGCDPAVFGEQISTYLREAAAERAVQADLDDEPRDAFQPATSRPAAIEPRAPQPVVEQTFAAEQWNDEPEPVWAAPIETPAPPAPVEEPLAATIEPWTAEPVPSWAPDPIEPPAPTLSVEQPSTDASERWAAEVIRPWTSDPIESAAPTPSVEQLLIDASDRWAAEPLRPRAAKPVKPWAAEPSEDPLIDLSEEVAGLSDEVDGELFDGERVGVYTISADADNAEAEQPEAGAFDLLPAILEPLTKSRPAAAAAAEIAPDESFADATESPRADITPWVPMYLTPGRLWPALEGMPAEAPAPRTEQPDWIELVASLRQDLERRRTEPPAVAVPIAARPSEGGEAESRRLVKKPKPPHAKKPKPVQDEWGFFDPEQCGFSTLLAKLEEITDEA